MTLITNLLANLFLIRSLIRTSKQLQADWLVEQSFKMRCTEVIITARFCEEGLISEKKKYFLVCTEAGSLHCLSYRVKYTWLLSTWVRRSRKGEENIEDFGGREELEKPDPETKMEDRLNHWEERERDKEHCRCEDHP